MATENSTNNSASAAERLDVALDATYEIEHLCDATMVLANESTSTDAILFRGLAARVLALNSIIMSVVGKEDGRTTEDMKAVLFGRRAVSDAD